MKYRLAKNVKEVAGTPSSNVLTILKDLSDQTGNLKSFTNTNAMVENEIVKMNSNQFFF